MSKLLLHILLISTFVTFCACGGNRILSEDEVAISEQIELKLTEYEALVFEEDTLQTSEFTLNYYQNNDFAPIWIEKDQLNGRGEQLLSEIEGAYHWGLMPEMYNHSLIKKNLDSSILDAEFLLTDAFFLMSTHISVGFIDSTSKTLTWKKDSLRFDLTKQLNKVINGDSIATVLAENEPDFWDYKQLKNGLIDFVEKYPLDTNHYEIPAFKEDSTKCYEVTKDALIGHSFLDTSEADNDSIFIERLKEFQRVNGLLDDAIVGKWTSRKLAQSNLERFYQGALALEKWRWKKEAYPERYIRVNIPQYTLFFVDSNNIKRKHRVIVGAYATQTPEFSARMKTMVTYPFWHLPYSISSTEFLWAARKDTAYVRKKHYKIFRKGEEVNPDSVDWSKISQFNFPYKVRQDGGAGNSLGNIKFLFPNKHMVFIHDTPGRYLFKNDIRAYSHGCIRLENPFDLAKEIMTTEENKMIIDTLNSVIQRKEQRVIEVKKKFDVFIEYISAVGDSSGNVIFYPDVYNRDEKIYKSDLKTLCRIS